MKIPALAKRLSPPAPPRRVERLLSIDPGNKLSAYIEYFPKTKTWGRKGKVPNTRLLAEVYLIKPDAVVCENMQFMGMGVGATVFDTIRYAGRIQQICFQEDIPFHLIFRSQIKKHLCKGIRRAKDGDVRRALIAIYGEQGTKKAPGGTFGIANDVWSALAIAHTFTETVL